MQKRRLREPGGSQQPESFRQTCPNHAATGLSRGSRDVTTAGLSKTESFPRALSGPN